MMNKYEIALENIKGIVIDELARPYYEPKFLVDFHHGSITLLQELVDRETNEKGENKMKEQKYKLGQKVYYKERADLRDLKVGNFEIGRVKMNGASISYCDRNGYYETEEKNLHTSELEIYKSMLKVLDQTKDEVIEEILENKEKEHENAPSVF